MLQSGKQLDLRGDVFPGSSNQSNASRLQYILQVDQRQRTRWNIRGGHPLAHKTTNTDGSGIKTEERESSWDTLTAGRDQRTSCVSTDDTMRPPLRLVDIIVFSSSSTLNRWTERPQASMVLILECNGKFFGFSPFHSASSTTTFLPEVC